MIYAVLPYYPREGTLAQFLGCLRKQTEDYKLIVITAGDGIELPGIRVLNAARRTYWTESMQLAYRYLLRQGDDADVICILNDDLSFDEQFFSLGSKVDFGEVYIPSIYEGDLLVDGGIEIDWKSKSFKPGGSIDCFSPRGVFMKLKDFRASEGFCRWLPHYGSDYEWSIRLIKGGLKPLRIGRMTTTRATRTTTTFSKLNPANPIYWTIFLFLCGRNRYLPINLLRVWLDPLVKRGESRPASF